jgi:RNA polymerase sigma-70 factor (ECF subfamily)
VRITRIVNENIDFVSRVLLNLGVPAANIDDAVQQTFLVINQRLDDIVPAAEKSFLFTAARNVAWHARRSLALRRIEPLGKRELSHDESPERALTQKRARENLERILDLLPTEQRIVFILFEFEEFSGPEIAQMLGIPGGTVASRLRRARVVFRDEVRRLELGPDGLDYEAVVQLWSA